MKEHIKCSICSHAHEPQQSALKALKVPVHACFATICSCCLATCPQPVPHALMIGFYRPSYSDLVYSFMILPCTPAHTSTVLVWCTLRSRSISNAVHGQSCDKLCSRAAFLFVRCAPGS
eukprot:1140941-Pelagomonas_calceolata.AAC.4